MFKILVTLSVAFLFLLSCSNNVLSDLNSKTTDEAYLFDAQTAVNAQQYQSAIDIITQKLSATAQTSVAARELLANAYAGKCGLNFVDYTDSLSQAVSTSAFVIAATPFVGKVVDPASCLTALKTLDLIGATASRTTNQNAFASVLGMVLMGSATRLITDDNPVNGDGVQDVVGISCSLTDPQIDNVVLGYAYMAQNFTALSAAQIGSGSQTTITNSIAVCSAIAGASCTNTDPALITPLIRDTMRDLMNTSQYGVGVFDASNPANIPVSCP
jgi:hypothetical protein